MTGEKALRSGTDLRLGKADTLPSEERVGLVARVEIQPQNITAADEMTCIDELVHPAFVEARLHKCFFKPEAQPVV